MDNYSKSKIDIKTTTEERKRMEAIALYNERKAYAFNNPTEENALKIWLEARLPPPVHPSVPLATLHKARLQWLDVTDEQIEESLQWLKEHGYKPTMRGAPPLTPESRDRDRVAIGRPPLKAGGSH